MSGILVLLALITPTLAVLTLEARVHRAIRTYLRHKDVDVNDIYGPLPDDTGPRYKPRKARKAPELCGEGPDVGKEPCIRESGHSGPHLEPPQEPRGPWAALGPFDQYERRETGIHGPGGPAL